MKIILEQMALLFSFMCLGYFFGKRKLVDSSHTKLISALCVNLFMPCTVFKAFYSNFNREYLTGYSSFILTSLAILAVLLIIGFFVSKLFTDNKYRRSVCRYSLVVSNYAYMGYALAEGIYGSEGLLNIVIFAMPIAFFVYSGGYCMLTKRGFSLKKIVNPVIVSLILGALVGYSGIRIPDFIITFTSKSSGCMAPMSMLLAGITISEYKLKDLVGDKIVYVMTAIRLVVIPLLVYLILKNICTPDLTRTAVLLFCMPYGLNPIIFAKLIGEDYFFPAKLAFVSSILSIVTVPIFLSLF
ncbi:MAG: AEC family transporter [Clostridia bacterium]|nr:AEC family transporter [Clostridia bacterium]